MRPQILLAGLAGLAVAAPVANTNFDQEVHQLIARQAADVAAAADPSAGAGAGAEGTLDTVIERLQSLTSTLQKVKAVMGGDYSSITSLLPALPSVSSFLPSSLSGLVGGATGAADGAAAGAAAGADAGASAAPAAAAAAPAADAAAAAPAADAAAAAPAAAAAAPAEAAHDADGHSH